MKKNDETKTFYEGLREKLFAWTIGIIGTGVIALCGMVWNLSINQKVNQTVEDYKIESILKVVETSNKIILNTNEVAKKNNIILISKADDSTNNLQHLQLMHENQQMKTKLDKLQRDLNNYTGGAFGSKMTPSYEESLTHN